MNSLWPLQVALKTRWQGDTSVIAQAAGGIHDGEAPPDAEYPFVVIGEKTGTLQGSTLEAAGTGDTLTAHAFSLYLGNKEVEALGRSLNNSVKIPLAVEGYGSVKLKPEFQAVLLERLQDGRTARHLTIRYRAFVLEAA